MSDRVKMILRLAVFSVIVAGIAAALYFAFFRGAPTVTPVEEVADESLATGGLPGSGAAGARGETDPDETDGNNGGTLPPSAVADGGATAAVRLTNTAVLSPTVTSSNTIAYFDPADGRFYTINDDGEVERLSAQQFTGAEAVTFSPNAESAVIEFPDGSNVVYGFTSGKQITLPAHWEDFSFSGNGEEIASKSIGTDPSNRSLVVTSTDGAHTEIIAALGNNSSKVAVNWSPSGNIVAFSRTGTTQSGFGRQQYYLIGLDGEATGALIVEGSDFSAIWAPGGANLVYSVADAANNYRASLWYADSEGDRNGDPRSRIALETWVEKCTFASAAELYCAVPDEMVDGAGANHSLIEAEDSVYRIDLPSGKTTLIGYPAVRTQMAQLSLSNDGRTLYFLDDSGRLNSLRIN